MSDDALKVGGVDDPGFGVYIHWPYCAAICPYCAFNVYRQRSDDQAALVEAIATDLRGWRNRTGPKPLRSIYFGGGTPSRMPPEAVAQLIEACTELWAPESEIEVSLEANPDDCEPARLAALASAGANRLSIGVQALDDRALKDLGRWHSAADAEAAVGAALNAFERVSLDLISMRPGQEIDAWRAELDRALKLGVEHVSIYELTIEPGTAFEHRARRGELPQPDDERGAAFFEATNAACAAAGFDGYEVSNHARGAAARSAHNLIYWRSGEWVGAGPGAHGRLGPFGDARLATEAARTPKDYVAAVEANGWGVVAEEALDRQAQLEEALLMGLRLAEGVPLARLDQIADTGVSADKLEQLVAEGLIARQAGRLAATEHGRPLIDRLVLELIGF